MPTGVSLAAFLIAVIVAYIGARKGNFKMALIGFVLILVSLVPFKHGLSAEIREIYLEIIEGAGSKIG